MYVLCLANFGRIFQGNEIPIDLEHVVQRPTAKTRLAPSVEDLELGSSISFSSHFEGVGQEDRTGTGTGLRTKARVNVPNARVYLWCGTPQSNR